LSVLRQGQFSPVGMAEQTLLLYALDKGLLLKSSEEQRNQFRKEIFTFAREHNQAILDEIEQQLRMTPGIEKGLGELMGAYFQQAGGNAG
jgi:F0F1-type ATP synthase alpha subunit